MGRKTVELCELPVHDADSAVLERDQVRVAEVAVLEHERCLRRPKDLEHGERALGEIGFLAPLSEVPREASEGIFDETFECAGNCGGRPRKSLEQIEHC